MDLDGDGRALGERAERRLEAVLGENGRVDPARELAQLVEGRAEFRLRVGDELMGPQGVVVDHAVRHPQLKRERDEPLLRAVVQVPLEAAPLGVSGLDDAGARRGELLVRICVRDRLRDEIGEVAQPPFRPFREPFRTPRGCD